MEKRKNEIVKLKLSTLWIVIMINMIFADILGFVIHFVEGGAVEVPGEVKVTMLIAAIVTQVPIWMIYLARFLKYKINRRLNIAAAAFSMLYVIGGGDLAPHYIFIASVEVLCMVFIIKTAWQWRESK